MFLADQARAGSKSHTSQTLPRIMDVNPSAVEQTFRIAQVSQVIHGHTHRPAMHDALAGGGGTIRPAHRARGLVRAGQFPALPRRTVGLARVASLRKAGQCPAGGAGGAFHARCGILPPIGQGPLLLIHGGGMSTLNLAIWPGLSTCASFTIVA